MPTEPRELLDAKEVAWLFGFSKSQFYALDQMGVFPAGFALGGGKRKWRRRELVDWINSNCPLRSEWKWRPTVPAKLDDLIRARADQAAKLLDEIKWLETLKAEGQHTVHLRNP